VVVQYNAYVVQAVKKRATTVDVVVHCKKRLVISQPGCHLSKCPWRDSLESDIPAGAGKIDNLFFTV
jgi:hypothetical protein